MNEAVLPQPNLNDEAVQWSRQLNRRTRDTSRELSRLSQNLLMTNRANAGQMGVMGRQLEQLGIAQAALEQQQLEISGAVSELQARSSHQVSPADLRLTYGTGYGQKGPSTRDFSFPAPVGGRRTSILTGSGVFKWAGGTAAAASGIYLRAEVVQGGTVVGSGRALVSPRPMVPSEFEGDSFSLAVALNIPDTGSSFQVRLYGYRTADGGTSSDAGDLRNMQFVLTYGDRY